jgi:hypothetical protein
MSMPQGAVRYQCPCGAEYLVALQGISDETWLEKVTAIARTLGLEIVDGAQPSFVCRSCERRHLRAGAQAEHTQWSRSEQIS